MNVPIKTATTNTMTAKTNTTKNRTRQTGRQPEILREFFAAALVLAAIKSSDQTMQPAMQGFRR